MPSFKDAAADAVAVQVSVVMAGFATFTLTAICGPYGHEAVVVVAADDDAAEENVADHAAQAADAAPQKPVQVSVANASNKEGAG